MNDKVEELKRKIQNNIEMNSDFSIFRPTDYLLEFLSNQKLSCNDKIDAVSIFHEGKKQSRDLYLFGGIMVIGILYAFTSNTNVGLILFLIGCLGLVPSLIQYFNNDEQLHINKDGIRIKKKELLEWPIIDYIYFRTDWDGEGNYPENQLIILLRSGRNKKINIDNLNKTKNQIGRLMYCAMKQFKKNNYTQH